MVAEKEKRQEKRKKKKERRQRRDGSSLSRTYIYILSIYVYACTSPLFGGNNFTESGFSQDLLYGLWSFDFGFRIFVYFSFVWTPTTFFVSLFLSFFLLLLSLSLFLFLFLPLSSFFFLFLPLLGRSRLRSWKTKYQRHADTKRTTVVGRDDKKAAEEYRAQTGKSSGETKDRVIEGYLSIRYIPAMLPTTMVGPDRTRVSIHRHDTTRYDTVRYDTTRHDTTPRDSRLQAAWLKPIVEDCLKIACLCRLSVAVVCRYINTRERKGKEGKDSVFRHSFRKHRSRARDSRQNRRKSRESNNALSFCLVDFRNCLETKHHGTSLSGLLAEFFSSRPRSEFHRIDCTYNRRSNTDRFYIFFVQLRKARRDIRTLVAERFTKIRRQKYTRRENCLSIFSIEMKRRRRTIAFEFQRENRHAVSSRYRRA